MMSDALVILAMGFLIMSTFIGVATIFHGFNFITIHKHYREKEDEE